MMVDATDRAGHPVRRWIIFAQPFTEILNKPWFVPQVLTGPVAVIAARYSVLWSAPSTSGGLFPQVPRTHGRLAEIGTLYTAVAGMLNLLTIIDASYRAARAQGKSNPSQQTSQGAGA